MLAFGSLHLSPQFFIILARTINTFRKKITLPAMLKDAKLKSCRASGVQAKSEVSTVYCTNSILLQDFFFLRNVYLLFSYFWFFVGLPMGFFSAIFRILKSLAVCAVMLPRIDHSIMPDGFQWMDKGKVSLPDTFLSCIEILYQNCINKSVHLKI